jgi:3-methyladenine DNA glycosylase AlkC
MSDNSPSLLRNSIGRKSIGQLSERISSVHAEFNKDQFSQLAFNNIDELGLNERIKQVRIALNDVLPNDFTVAVGILVKALGAEIPQDNLDGVDLTSSHGFIVLPQCEFVAHYGQQDFEVSMLALMEMTKRFSSEGAIRAFIEKHFDATYLQLKKWIKHDNVHVRRLVSEGTRPRLPLFSRLPRFIKDPALVIELLDELKDDSELYVRRSVANNLNDISKDHPKQVTDLLSKWSVGADDNRRWLIKHALRTLLKKGDKAALAILGFAAVPKLKVVQFSLDKSHIKLGEELNISMDLLCESDTSHNMMIDYVVHHKKANGSLTPKVFKWTQKSISRKSPLKLCKKHSIKAISTRKYYAGEHEVHLQINGEILAKCHFNLAL